MPITWGNMHARKVPGLQRGDTWATWELPGGAGWGGALDGEALGLERSPAATTTPPLFDVENDILPILHKMLFKPNFHSP